jgi:hypothetical protein
MMSLSSFSRAVSVRGFSMSASFVGVNGPSAMLFLRSAPAEPTSQASC